MRLKPQGWLKPLSTERNGPVFFYILKLDRTVPFAVTVPLRVEKHPRDCLNHSKPYRTTQRKQGSNVVDWNGHWWEIKTKIKGSLPLRVRQTCPGRSLNRFVLQAWMSGSTCPRCTGAAPGSLWTPLAVAYMSVWCELRRRTPVFVDSLTRWWGGSRNQCKLFEDVLLCLNIKSNMCRKHFQNHLDLRPSFPEK